MKTSITIEWASWAAECVALDIEAKVIKDTLLQAGIDELEVAKLILGIKHLPGFVALERMTKKYSSTKKELDALKMTQEPLFSIIMICYNNVQYIKAAIESVNKTFDKFLQTPKGWNVTRRTV